MSNHLRTCRFKDEKGNIFRVDPTAIVFTDNEFRNYFFPEPKK